MAQTNYSAWLGNTGVFAFPRLMTPIQTNPHGLTAMKLSHNSSWRPLETLVYIVLVTNDGRETIHSILIRDDLGGTQRPLAFVPHSAILNQNGVLMSLIPADTSPLILILPNRLEPGESAAVTYLAQVRGDMDPHILEITNTAVVSVRQNSSADPLVAIEPFARFSLPRASPPEAATANGAEDRK